MLKVHHHSLMFLAFINSMIISKADYPFPTLDQLFIQLIETETKDSYPNTYVSGGDAGSELQNFWPRKD